MSDADQRLFKKALEDSDTAKVKQLISHEFYIDQVIDDLPPLSLAIIEGQLEIAELLISSGADINQLDASGKYSPIFYAIKHRCPKTIIRRLILAGAPKDGIVEYNFRSTPLHLAVYSNQKSLIKCLLSLSVDVNSKDINDMTPLHVAVQTNHPKIVKMLAFKGANLEAECSDKFTPLMLAIHDNNSEMVKLLISLGSKVNYKPEQPKYAYQMPLNYAAGLGLVEIMQILLDHGADPNSSNVFGDTPLHSIAQSDKLADKAVIQDAIRILLEHGSDLSSFNDVGHNPLHSSIIMKKTVTTKCLLKSGSSALIPTKNEDTPLHLAVVASDSVIVKLLLTSGANIAAINSFGLTAYDLALKYADMNTVLVLWSFNQPFDEINLKSQEEIKEDIQRLLDQQKDFFHAIELGNYDKMVNALENGAEPKGCSLSIRYPLHYVVSKNDRKIVDKFLERGVPVCIFDNHGETPLHLASKCGNVQMCVDLLSHGACYNSIARCGKTPYEMAYNNNQENVVKFLGIIEYVFKVIENNTLEITSVLNSWDKTAENGEANALRIIMNCVNNEGHTILSKAISNGFHKEAQTIMSYRLQKLKIGYKD